ncbi:hypothetical protein TRFO_37682 [Tritrichomonas foetus]|uniref:F5/8 type C domain-containing protein n=1 Tax=Tritrichomonas foetus TaxID=1144522 RepID=A0A1J4JET0_9EUKA|nr:hypothetical protein TRFO_37682 [Tritrichomonas foetus]|eukprot:OHS96147.1 hypothetical protein TRFO_37682 [Tritrichomonas foetus]
MFQWKPQNINQINLNNYENDFSLIINKYIIQTPRIVADLFSKKIENFHYLDSSIESYKIQTDSPDSREVCKFIESYLTFKVYNIQKLKSSDIKILLTIVDDLQCSGEILDVIYSKHQMFSKYININNVIDRIIFKQSLSKEMKFIEEEISFLASHFYEIDEKVLLNSNFDLYHYVFTHEDIKLKDEGSLLHLIIELTKINPKFNYLFGYVNFSALKESEIAEFLTYFDYTQLTHEIWSSICRKLLPNHKHISNKVSFPVSESISNGGILKYISVYKRPLRNSVNLFASSLSTGNLYSLFDDSKDSIFCTGNIENSSIKIVFKNMKVRPTYYSISSGPNNFLRNWILEYSKDKINWIELDKHENDSSLCHRYISQSFDISEPVQAQIFRLRQTGKNSNLDNILCLSKFELYGSIFEE